MHASKTKTIKCMEINVSFKHVTLYNKRIPINSQQSTLLFLGKFIYWLIYLKAYLLFRTYTQKRKRTHLYFCTSSNLTRKFFLPTKAWTHPKTSLLIPLLLPSHAWYSISLTLTLQRNQSRSSSWFDSSLSSTMQLWQQVSSCWTLGWRGWGGD